MEAFGLLLIKKKYLQYNIQPQQSIFSLQYFEVYYNHLSSFYTSSIQTPTDLFPGVLLELQADKQFPCIITLFSRKNAISLSVTESQHRWKIEKSWYLYSNKRNKTKAIQHTNVFPIVVNYHYISCIYSSTRNKAEKPLTGCIPWKYRMYLSVIERKCP